MLSNVNLRIKCYVFYRYLWQEILFAACYSGLIYYLYEQHELTSLTSFSFLPVGFLGAVLSVFLAFRNNSAYDRWWEARRLWGELVNHSRTFAMQLAVVLPAGQKELHNTLLRRHVAYVNLLRLQLRDEPERLQCNGFLNDEERVLLGCKGSSAATVVNQWQAASLRELAGQNDITDHQLVMLLATLAQFYNIQGGCERIKNTPFPRLSDEFIRMLLGLLILILPIYLLSLFSDDLSKLLVIPLSVALVAVIGFANTVGKTLEDPFENSIHDIPMSALCKLIARDLLPDDAASLKDAPTLSSHQVNADPVLW